MSFRISSKIIFNFSVALFIIGAVFLLLPNSVQAAKTITLKELSAPTNPSATPVAGGSLVASTTYYYKIVAVGPGTSYYNGDAAMWWASPSSAEVSATTDATNKSVKLYWDNHADASVWMIFRTTISGDYEVYDASTGTWHSHLIKAGTNGRAWGMIASDLTVSGSGYEWTDDGSKTLAKHPIVDVGVPCFEIEGGDVNDPITPKDLYDWAVTNGKTYCISSWDYAPSLPLPVAIKMVASVRQPQPGSTPLYFSIPDRTYFLQIWGKLWFDEDSYFNIGSNNNFPTKGGVWQRIGSYAWYCGTHGNIEWYDMAMYPPPSYVYNNLDSYCMDRGTMFQFNSGSGITAKMYQSTIDPMGRSASGRATAEELDVQGSKVYWRGANVGSANANIDDCKIQNIIIAHYGKREGVIKNSTFIDPSQYDFKGINYSSTEDQVTHLINVTFANDPVKLRSYVRAGYTAWQVILIKYEINIKVIDKNNNIIQNALVSLKDKNGYGAIWIDTDKLNEDISIGETEWTVVDGSKFTAGDYIRVNMETIKIDSITGNVLTVSRAQEGTIDRQYNTGQKIFLRHDTLETNASGDVTTIPAVKTIAYNRAEVAGYTMPMDVTTDLSPYTLIISHQDYPSREFEFTLDKKQNLIIALKDRPMSVGSIKVWGTEYADNEAGTIYAQITYGDGSPCNTINQTDITATVYKSDGTVMINGAQMSYVTNSNGIYKYDFTGGTFTDEGVYIIDVTANSIDPNITAYNSNEIHISKSANLISQNLDQKISEVASSTAQAVWSYTGSALDTTGNAISKVWSFAIRKLTSRQIADEANEHIAQEENVASNVWNTATSTITTSGSIGKHLVDNIDDKISNIASNVWGYTGGITSTLIQNLGDVVWNSYSGVRKLTSRQIGNGTVYIPGVTESGTITQVANEDDQETVKYDIDLVRKATFDFAGIVDSGTTLTLIDSELTHPDDHWNNYELWMMSGNNIGLKVTICDFDKASHTITICGDALAQSIAVGDQYVISHERKLVHSIWNWTDRQLDEVGNIASAVWGWTDGSRRLTDKTLTGGGELATESYINTATSTVIIDLESYINTATSTIIAEINDNETLLNNLNTITAQEVWEYATRSLTDYSTSTIAQASAGEVWNRAIIALNETGSIGKLLVDNIDSTISSRGTSDLTAGDVWSESTRTLTDYATSSIALAVWNNAQKTLTNYGNDITAVDVWNTLNSTLTTENSIGKQLADNVDATISSRAPSATALSSVTWTDEKAGYLDTTVSSCASQASVDTIQTDITYIRSKADSIYTDTQYINGKVDEIIAKWGSYSASDIVTDLDTIKTRIGTSTDVAADETLFGRTKFIQEKWGAQTGQTIYDIASSTLVLVGDVQTELGYNGTSTTAYADIQLVKGWIDELEGYMGTPSDDSSAETLFGKIKDVREKLDQLDTLEIKLDTIDSIVNTLRASQKLNYTVELSDVDEILQGNIYRTKLSIWDYENNPVDASTTPTITLYNTVRTEIASSSMTALSTGVYEYTYSVPSNATSGLWESVVNIDLGGTTALTLNDYWEVQGSPAQVIINSMSDLTIPSISANVTISNEGNSGYEYQYEWCVVDSQDNQCGEGDDIDYASAAKYLNIDEDWITKLGLTVPSTGDYWFKVVVYYGTEASGASRKFTAIEEEEEKETQSGSRGSGTMPVNLSKIYSKLLEVQNELGYHDTYKTAYKDLANTKYSLGILPNQISDPLYTILAGVSSNIQTIGGDQGYNLDNLYTVSQTDSGDLKYIVNKTAELKAMIDVNKLLISTVANQPIIKTWWEEGSIILKIMVANPLDAKARTVEVKEYLPKEVRSEHIIKIEQGLQLEYDSGLDSYFVSGEVELGPGERKTLAIRAEDVFKISEDELNSLKEQSDTLMAPLQGTSYFAQAAILKSEIDANINGILRQQTGQPTNIEKRILIFRDNQKDLQKVQKNIESLKQIVSEVSGKGGVFGSLFGVSTTMTWAIIIIVVVGIAVLMILLYTMLSRQRAMEHHISGGKRLKAPPIVDVKKQTRKIKGGLITYFLPPFGKPVVDLRQIIKMIKILIIVGILVVLVLLGFYFFESKNNSTQNNSDTQKAILNPSHTSKETTSPANESDVNVEMDLSFSEETEPNQEVATKQNKLKIIETGIGWLNVRSKPSTTDSKILDTVDVGEEFDYTDQQDNWYKIILDDDDKTEGWVFREYIEIISNF